MCSWLNIHTTFWQPQIILVVVSLVTSSFFPPHIPRGSPQPKLPQLLAEKHGFSIQLTWLPQNRDWTKWRFMDSFWMSSFSRAILRFGVTKGFLKTAVYKRNRYVYVNIYIYIYPKIWLHFRMLTFLVVPSLTQNSEYISIHPELHSWLPERTPTKPHGFEQTSINFGQRHRWFREMGLKGLKGLIGVEEIKLSESSAFLRFSWEGFRGVIDTGSGGSKTDRN